MHDISERQHQIIITALEIIAKQGIQALTIKNLSKEIGFTEAAIYRHFESKVQILITILDFFQESSNLKFSETNLNQINPNQIDANELIRKVFNHHFIKFSEIPSLVAVIFSDDIFKNEIMLSNKINSIMKNNIDSLSNIIKIGQQNNQFRIDINADELSIIFLGSLRLYIKRWQDSNYSFDLILEGQKFVNSLLKLIKGVQND